MSRARKTIGGLVVLAAFAAGVHYVYPRIRAERSGLLSQRIEHNGDAWEADFTARIAAPEKSVFDAIRNQQSATRPGTNGLRVLSDTGNRTTVEMQLAGPSGQTVTTRLVFHYFPSEGRITYHTIDAHDFITRAEYRLESDGGSTLIMFHEVTTVHEQLRVPDSVVREVIHDLFMAHLESLTRGLGIRGADSSQPSGP